VTAIENTHFGFHKGAAAGKHKSYSYRFETPGRVIVFTSDTGPFDGLVEFAKGADLLVAQANSIEQLSLVRSHLLNPLHDGFDPAEGSKLRVCEKPQLAREHRAAQLATQFLQP
jgi:hypothetical protein